MYSVVDSEVGPDHSSVEQNLQSRAVSTGPFFFSGVILYGSLLL